MPCASLNLRFRTVVPGCDFGSLPSSQGRYMIGPGGGSAVPCSIAKYPLLMGKGRQELGPRECEGSPMIRRRPSSTAKRSLTATRRGTPFLVIAANATGVQSTTSTSSLPSPSTTLNAPNGEREPSLDLGRVRVSGTSISTRRSTTAYRNDSRPANGRSLRLLAVAPRTHLAEMLHGCPPPVREWMPLLRRPKCARLLHSTTPCFSKTACSLRKPPTGMHWPVRTWGREGRVCGLF